MWRLARRAGSAGASASSCCAARTASAWGRTGRSAWQQAFALSALAGQLAGAADGFRLFAGALFRRLFIMSAHLHFAEDAFALHFLLQRAKRLVNIVVADKYLHWQSCS
jgi:hypothetical protein